MKLLGGLLLLAATVAVNINDQNERRKIQILLVEMKNALGDIASQIRWKNLPLPDCMKAQINRPQAGVLFKNTLVLMESKAPLQAAWKQSVSDIRQINLREMLLYLDWQGDTQRLLGNLGYAQQQIEQLSAQERSRSSERRKLVWAVSLSLCCMLIIIML